MHDTEMMRPPELHPPSMARFNVRRSLWVIVVLIFGAWVAFARVHTHLGVKAPFDKDGRELIWRIWWRARDDIISQDSSLFMVAYLGLVAAFAALAVLAMWVALVPDNPAEASPPPFVEE